MKVENSYCWYSGIFVVKCIISSLVPYKVLSFYRTLKSIKVKK